jgi:hypothetical protein
MVKGCLLSDLFHDHNGDLKIQINPINTTSKAATTTSISGGEQDPLLDIKEKFHCLFVSFPLYQTFFNHMTNAIAVLYKI